MHWILYYGERQLRENVIPDCSPLTLDEGTVAGGGGGGGGGTGAGELWIVVCPQSVFISRPAGTPCSNIVGKQRNLWKLC